VRGVNLSDELLSVKFESLLPIRSAHLARIDEIPLEELSVEDRQSLTIEAQPRKILTLRLDLEPDKSD
jgi:hypothetical protein